MRTATIAYNGCKLTLREKLGRDVIDTPHLYDCIVSRLVKRDYPSLSPDEREEKKSQYYEGLAATELVHTCNMLIQVANVEGELPEGVILLGNLPSDDTIFAAYESVLNAPYDFVLLWRNTISALGRLIPLASPDV